MSLSNSPDFNQRLVHELQVHQTELEAQNEQLRLAYLDLKESQTKYVALYDSLPAGHFTLDQSGTILQANQTAARLLGIDRILLLSQAFHQFVLAEDKDQFYLMTHEHFQSGETRSCELRLMGGSGLPFWVNLVCAESGRLETAPQLSLSFEDISDRIQARTAQAVTEAHLDAVRVSSAEMLENTTKRFETVLSNLQGGILLVGNDGRLEYMNQALLDIFGLDSSPESFIGTRALDILPLLMPSFENPQASMQLIHNRITANQPVRGEELRMTRGRVFMRDFIPIVLDGVVCGRLWFHQDITERKHSEEALQRSEQQLRMLIEAIPDAIFFKDGVGRLQIVNEPAKQLFQWTDCTWQGKTDLELGLENPEFQALHQACAIDDEKAWQAKHLVVLAENPIDKNGCQLDFDVRKMPVFDAQGNRQALVIIGRDVTAANLAARELAQTTQQLKALSQRVLTVQEAERRRIALELHDELGQSLTALKINLQRGLAFQTPAGVELHAQNLQIVSNSLAQVRRLSLALRPSVLDDLGLVAALEWLADQMSVPNGLAVTLHTPLAEVKFSPVLETAFFRVAQEALTNVARHAKAKQVVMSLHIRGHELVLQVQDDGVGFDAITCLARAKAGGSMGVLGMQERAVLLGGQFEIDSHGGQGTTVRLACDQHAPEGSA